MTDDLLKPEELRVLNAFKKLIARGAAPSIAELARAAKMKSRDSTHRYVERLIELGYLERERDRSHRSLRLAGDAPATGASLPYLGRIAAGGPIESPTGEDAIDLARLLCTPERFVLTAEGESMVGAGIQPGDLLIMDSARTPQSGDLVAVLIDDTENTLRSIYYKDDGRVTLNPANEAFKPLTLDPDRITVKGVLAFHIRRYE